MCLIITSEGALASEQWELAFQWGKPGHLNGEFNRPTGIAEDSINGWVYVADTGNNRIQKFSYTGNFLGSWGSFGNAEGQFNEPSDIGCDRYGNVYVTDSKNHRVQKFKSDGTFLTRWGSYGGILHPYAKDDYFKEPRGLCVNEDFVYVADSGNSRIKKFSLDGDCLSHWGMGAIVASDGLLAPMDVSANGSFVFVCDTGFHRIQKYSLNGEWLSVLDPIRNEYTPTAVSSDANGTIWVIDAFSRKVLRYSPNAKKASEISLPQTGSYTWGLSLTRCGYFYVSDGFGNQVLVFRVKGDVTGDGLVSMADVIAVLKTLSGVPVDLGCRLFDSSSITIETAVYILQLLGGMI